MSLQMFQFSLWLIVGKALHRMIYNGSMETEAKSKNSKNRNVILVLVNLRLPNSGFCISIDDGKTSKVTS